MADAGGPVPPAIFHGTVADNRARHSSVKWRFHPTDVVPVWVAEMDAEPCGPAVAAATRALADGDLGYGWYPPLIDAFRDFADHTWGWRPRAAGAVVVADVMTGIAELIHVLTPPGGAVVISPPVYDSFFGFVASTRRRLVTAPLDGGHRLDMAALDAAFRDAGRDAMYLLCSPHNPTGTVHTPAELAALAELADRHGVTVVSDEIHAPLVHDGARFTPYLAVAGAQRGITVTSASKSWNLAGLRAALVLPGAEAGPAVGELHEVVRHGAQHVAILAQTAAYTDGGPWLTQAHAELARNRALLAALLAEHLPRVRMTAAQATYLAWLDCREADLGDDPAAVFLTRGRVALSSGLMYDPGAGHGFARFNYATSPEVITEAVTRMARAAAASG